MSTCQYCDKDCSNPGGLAAHQRSCKKNPKRDPWTRDPSASCFKKGNTCGAGNKGQVPWNKGKKGVQKPTVHTKETKKILSDAAKERGLGGYKPGSGRGKKGWYKDIFCDSSWELAYVIYCKDHNINIQRCKERRTYVFENKEKTYIPDFIVDGNIVEIKGYKTDQWLAKLSHNKDVIVLYESDLKDVFAYVKDTYGKDYIKLYGR